MKIKHNKKRNTAFVYEALVKEITISVLKNDELRKQKAINILQKHFKKGTVLRRHLDCYRSIYETTRVSEKVSEKIINEARIASRLLDTEGLFVSHSDLIDDVNRELDPQVFNNFVPNYKTLASIYQIFSSETTPKNSVILENQIVKFMSNAENSEKSFQPIDNLVLESFIGKFNDKYNGELLSEQKTLLNLYITSFTDNSLQLKSFLNEEVARLKNVIVESYSNAEMIEDDEMSNKAKKVVTKLGKFKDENVSDSVLSTVLKTQQLAKELTDGDNN